MDGFTEGGRWERVGWALAIILAPLLFSFQEITYPAVGDTATQQLATGGANYGLWLADIYAELAAGVLFVATAIAVVRIARRRGRALARIGAVLTVLGVCVAILPKVGLQLMQWAMAGPGVDHAKMAAFLAGAQQSPAGAPVFVAQNFFALGVVLLGIAVWRSGFGYRWAGLLAAAGIVLDVALGMAGLEDSPSAGIVVGIISDGLLCVGFVAIGLRLLLPVGAEERNEAVAPAARATTSEA